MNGEHFYKVCFSERPAAGPSQYSIINYNLYTMSTARIDSLLLCLAVSDGVAFVEHKQVVGDAIYTIYLATVYISDATIYRMNDGTVSQHGCLGPIQDGIDEVVQSVQVLCLYDDACNVGAMKPELIEKIVDVVRDMDL